MLHVGIAKLPRFVIVLQVVIALRQTEPALRSAADHHGAVLEVLARREAEECANTHSVQAFGFGLEVGDGLKRRDAR